MAAEFNQSHHVVGQEGLFDMEEAVRERPVLRERAALSRMLVPEVWGVSEDRYSRVTRRMIEAADPDVLSEDLYNMRYAGETGVAYPGFDGKEVLVSLTPAEYTLVSRNVPALGRASLNRTLAARPDIAQSRGAAERSVVHTYEKKLMKMEEYLDGHLQSQRLMLKKFQKAQQHPGLSMFGPEVNLRMEIPTYRAAIDEAVVAMGAHRGLTHEQRGLVTKAIEWRILFMRQGNQHISNFGQLTNMLVAYNQSKQNVFRSRIHQLERALSK